MTPGERGTILFDLDGTLVRHGTTEWLPGALHLLALVEARGYEVRFVTRRGDREFADHRVYGRAPTLAMLAEAGLGSRHVWFDVRSPRILVDDSLATVIERETNSDVDADTRAILAGLDALEWDDAPEPIVNWICEATGCTTWQRGEDVTLTVQGWQHAEGQIGTQRVSVTRCPAHRADFDDALIAACRVARAAPPTNTVGGCAVCHGPLLPGEKVRVLAAMVVAHTACAEPPA